MHYPPDSGYTPLCTPPRFRPHPVKSPTECLALCVCGTGVASCGPRSDKVSSWLSRFCLRKTHRESHHHGKSETSRTLFGCARLPIRYRPSYTEYIRDLFRMIDNSTIPVPRVPICLDSEIRWILGRSDSRPSSVQPRNRHQALKNALISTFAGPCPVAVFASGILPQLCLVLRITHRIRSDRYRPPAVVIMQCPLEFDWFWCTSNHLIDKPTESVVQLTVVETRISCIQLTTGRFALAENCMENIPQVPTPADRGKLTCQQNHQGYQNWTPVRVPMWAGQQISLHHNPDNLDKNQK